MLELNTIHLMDSVDLLMTFPKESIDLIVTDPPYGIGYKADYRRSNDGRSRRVTRDTFGDDDLSLDWLPIAAQKLTQTGAMYVFTRWDVMHHTIQAGEAAGLAVKQRIIWDKLHWGVGNLSYYGSQVEDILFFVKGDHVLNWQKREGNVWRWTKMDVINYEGNFDNPTQKPERLIAKAIHRSSNPGDLVVDPFCGTGTTGAAARRANRNFICGDIDEYQYQIACGRLRQPFSADMFAHR